MFAMRLVLVKKNLFKSDSKAFSDLPNIEAIDIGKAAKRPDLLALL